MEKVEMKNLALHSTLQDGVAVWMRQMKPPPGGGGGQGINHIPFEYLITSPMAKTVVGEPARHHLAIEILPNEHWGYN